MQTVLLTILFCLLLEESVGVRIGSFNVQVFGSKKMSDKNVVEILTKIIRRYDIMLLMEIRDSSEKEVLNLLRMVNEQATSTKEKYDIVVSDRLGKSISKEQYAFFYRKRRVKVEASYTYSDPQDIMEREPLIVKFKISRSIRFVMIGVHIDPDEVVKEMNVFPDIVEDVKKTMKVSDILIAGDLNADCSYLPKKNYKKLELMQDSSYHWLIDNDADTTTKSSNCAYDRLIVTGEKLFKKICRGSAKVYRFDKEMNLDKEKTIDVSDHYPVELQLSVGRRACKND